MKVRVLPSTVGGLVAVEETKSRPSDMTTTTLMAGWEHHFTMAQALDPMGAVVGQRIAYVPGGVGGLGRSYFEVPSLPVAENYRVSVWDYTWFQAPSFPR